MSVVFSKWLCTGKKTACYSYKNRRQFQFVVVHSKEDSVSHLKTANIFGACGVFYVIVHRKEDFLLHLKKANISLCLRSFLCGCAQIGTWLWV